jgi:tetratricopeptide (TPR) repeat protein/predicted Ser/Thr protein kinase
MLRSDANGEAFMRDAALNLRAQVAAAPGEGGASDSIPAQIGRYRIIRKLGVGGMGVVYLAEQDQPRRCVAVKVIRTGFMTRDLLRRFEFEAQVLGQLRHPGIAHIYEFGTADTDGNEQSFFAMEYVEGPTLDRYASQHPLGTRERLKLMTLICDAIQHAHQKGVIHRDLKPGNILVDESGQPKVLDFGVARATNADMQLVTLQTGAGQLVGTIPYMSPEQVSGVPSEIDTRSDVYALGVICFELLTQCLPHNLRDRSIPEAARIIRDEEPSRLGSTHPALRGDLETIVAKALEKDKTRRYQSAAELSADIVHYLRNEPILARPQTTLYQLRKFARRNRGLVFGSGLVAAALIVGAVGTLWQAGVARREAKTARAAEIDARRIAEFQAHMLEQIDTNSAGDELLASMRAQFRRGISKGKMSPEARETKIAEFEEQLGRLNPTDLAANLIDTTILKPSIDSIARQFSEQPVIEASLNQTLATLYRTIGRYSDARPLQEKSLATRQRVLGESHADTLASMQDLGYLMRLQGDLPGAEALLNETLAKCRAALGPDHPVTLQTQSTCGGILRLKKQYPEAEACWRDVLERRRRVLGQDDQHTIISINNMGAVLQDEGKLAEAEIHFREALERSRRVLGSDNPTTLITQNFLGGLLWQQNRLDEAEAIHRETLEKRRRILGERHPRTINSIANLGELLFAAGKSTQAEPFLREACEKRRRVLGVSHTLTLASIDGLAGLLEAQARWKEAEPLRREAVTSLAGGKGDKSSEAAVARMHLGRVLLELGLFAEAETELVAAHQAAAVAGPNQKDAARKCVTLLVRLYESWDNTEPHKGHGAQRDSWKAMSSSAPSPARRTGE